MGGKLLMNIVFCPQRRTRWTNAAKRAGGSSPPPCFSTFFLFPAKFLFATLRTIRAAMGFLEMRALAGFILATAKILSPRASPCLAPDLIFPKTTRAATSALFTNCPEFTEPDADYVSGGVQSCVARDEKGVCAGLFGGTPEMSGMEEVCSGIDANDTFCFVGAPEAFPCEGLFRHVSLCNFDYNRPALNPFFCGARCGENQVAKGAGCSCAAGFEESAGGGACVPESQ